MASDQSPTTSAQQERRALLVRRFKTAGRAPFAAAALLCISTPAHAVADEQPNIVLIISDDQAYTDFGFMGHPVVQTPHLDRLAARSARYVDGYVPASLCRPSLVTLLTGLYPHQHGVHFNHPPPGFSSLRKLPLGDYLAARAQAETFIQDVPVLPRLLAEAGYRCLQTGKYWEGHYRNAGFTEGMTLGRPHAVEGRFGLRPAHGNGDAGLVIGRETMQPIYDFIDASAEPFFIWYAPFLPHTPHSSPERFQAMYAGRDDVADHEAAYFACCSWFDDTVGALIEHLERCGVADETLFVFVVDNGWRPDADAPGRPSRTSKRSPFESGIRTPILLHWEGRITPGEHVEPCSSIDLMPTLLDAAGIDVTDLSLPGISLLPSADGQAPLPQRPVFGAIYPGDASVLGNPSADVAYRWVRRGNFKLIVPHVRLGSSEYGGYLDAPALYDVVNDPNETRNLIDQNALPPIAQDLRRLLDAWWSPQP